MAAANQKYFKTTTEVDEAMANYEKSREAKDFTDEKKNRLSAKIDQMFAANKEAEKGYKQTVYSAKEMRNEYINSLVKAISVNVKIGKFNGVLSENRGKKIGRNPEFPFIGISEGGGFD